jgi:biopolymer transport protein ExbB
MSGISEALVATAIGLFVAIPAVLAFNFFQRLVRKSMAQSDAIAHVILGEVRAEGVAGKTEAA